MTLRKKQTFSAMGDNDTEEEADLSVMGDDDTEELSEEKYVTGKYFIYLPF